MMHTQCLHMQRFNILEVLGNEQMSEDRVPVPKIRLGCVPTSLKNLLARTINKNKMCSRNTMPPRQP